MGIKSGQAASSGRGWATRGYVLRATKAYIASLGTTGVLLAASLLMLAIVSAVVAFDRWPDGHVSTRVKTLVLAERPAPIRVSAHSGGASAAALARAIAARGGAAAPNRAGHGPALPRLGGRTAPAAPGAGTRPAPALPPVVSPPLQPVAPATPDRKDG